MNFAGRKCQIKSASAAFGIALFLWYLGSVLSGCSSGMSAPPPPPPAAINVMVSRSTATVDVGTTLHLTATVQNDPKNSGVTWSVSGGGTLSNQTATSVTYTGPGSTGSATITATAVADTIKTADTKVTVAALPQVTPPAQIPPVTIGQSYSLQLTVTGGTTPFTWSVAQGQLPNGLTLDTSTGLISGTAQNAVAKLEASENSAPSATTATTVSATVQVPDSSTPSQIGTLMLNFDVVGGNASALGFVYVAGDFVISEYSIGSDGTLTLLRPQSLPGSPLARSPGAGDQVLVVDPSHRFVYGIDPRGNEIHQYKIAADGTLTEMTPLTVTLNAGNATIVNSTGMVMNGGAAVYVSSNVGVFGFSVGQDGQLHQLGPPAAPAIGSSAADCIAISSSGSLISTCRNGGIDLYTVSPTAGTAQFLKSSQTLTDANGLFSAGLLAFNGDTQLIAAGSGHLSKFGFQNGNVDPTAVSTGPADSGILDLSIQAGGAFVVAGDLIVPMPPGGGTNDHFSLYDLQAGLGAPEKRDTGRGPGRVLALASNLQTGPPTPNPLVYVTNSRDNNIAQCIPATAPRCPTIAIVSMDIDPHGITGFLGSPGM